jgi:hypothetical protein
MGRVLQGCATQSRKSAKSALILILRMAKLATTVQVGTTIACKINQKEENIVNELNVHPGKIVTMKFRVSIQFAPQTIIVIQQKQVSVSNSLV